MIELSIDGRACRVAPGTTVLEAARAARIDIPTLCHHPAVAAFGACRLCVVEIAPGTPAGAAPRIVPSCLERTTEGMVVRTLTDDVRAIRQCIMELLLARSPGSPVLRQMASRLGVDLGRFPASGEAHGCILCGLCTRVCADAGFHAIAQHGRGAKALIAGPLEEPPPDCTGCASCAHVCPTGHITLAQDGATRTIWGRTFELACCPGCGIRTITRAQAQAAAARLGTDAASLERCPACGRTALAATIARLTAPASEATAACPADAAPTGSHASGRSTSANPQTVVPGGQR